MRVVFPAPVWPTMASVCPGSDVERNVAQNPVVILGIRAASVSEPHVAEFDVAARIGKLQRSLGRRRRQRLVQQLKNAFAGAMADCRMLNFSLRS